MYINNSNKNTNNNTNNAKGIGFYGLLTILFVGLKLTNFIDWSWWWVLAPLWMPTILAIVVLCLYLLWVLFAK